MSDGADLRERLTVEAPTAWNEYIQKASHVKGSLISKQKDLATGTIIRELDTEIKLNGGKALSARRWGDEPVRLFCDNQQYQFIIDQPAENKWSLVQLVWDDRRQETPSLDSVTVPGHESYGPSDWQGAIGNSCRALVISATWFPAMFSAPSFEVVRVAEENVGERQMVRVDFKYEPLNSKNNPIRSGYVVLDPSRFWLIAKANVEAHWPKEDVRGSIELVNEFDDVTSGFPYVVRQTSRRRTPEIDHEYTYECKLEVMDPSEDAPFMLSSYGIPEPEDPKQGSWSGLVFWNLLIIFCLIAAILFRRLARTPSQNT